MKIVKICFMMFLFFLIFPISVFSVCGDVNEDGAINIVDALITAQYYVDLNPIGFNAASADVDASGIVNIVDALIIARYYVGLITELSCTISTPEPTVLPGLEGNWGPLTYINLIFNSDQYIYDYSKDEWGGVVSLSGITAVTYNPDVSVRTTVAEFGQNTVYTLKSTPNIYSYYEIDVVFNNHGSMHLDGILIRIQDYENAVITQYSSKYHLSAAYCTEHIYESNIIRIHTNEIVLCESTDTVIIDFTLNRQKTLLLQKNTVHKLRYPLPDNLQSFNINQTTFSSTAVIGGDQIIELNAAYYIQNDILIVEDGNPMIADFPIQFYILYDEYNSMYLKRSIPDPLESEVLNYYELEKQSLISWDYEQIFVK